MVNFLLKKFPGELENLCFFFSAHQLVVQVGSGT